MPAKTIFISEKNAKYYAIAAKIEGTSLSEILAQALRQYLIDNGLLKLKKVKKGATK